MKADQAKSRVTWSFLTETHNALGSSAAPIEPSNMNVDCVMPGPEPYTHTRYCSLTCCQCLGSCLCFIEPEPRPSIAVIRTVHTNDMLLAVMCERRRHSACCACVKEDSFSAI